MPQTPAGDDRPRQVGDAQFVWRAFDELPFMVIALEGPQLRVTAATAAFRSRTGRSEPIGTPLGDLFPDDSWEIAQVCQAAYATGRPQTIQDVRIRIDGPGGAEPAEALLDLTVMPRHGADGRSAGVLVQVADAAVPVAAARPGKTDQGAESAAGSEAAHEVVVTLQRELLPAGVPVLPELEISASYLPAGEHTAAGGDWFDAVPLADGRVALAVGDVVGHGAAAAATMAKLRIVLRDRLAATADLLAAVRALDVAASADPATRAATACVAVFDPTTGELTYCTAGHPPPLLAPRKAEAVFLPPTGAGPLGVGGGFTAEQCQTVTLDVGAMVVLYTDGILERPGSSPAQASVALAQTVTDVAMNRALYDGRRPAERVCTQTVELLTHVTGHCDDITVLAAQRLNAPEPLDLTISARRGHVARARQALSEWLADLGVGDRDYQAVRHAVLELVANSVEHAYTGVPAPQEPTVRLTASVSRTGTMTAQVRDTGRWREPRPGGDRGRGLHLAASMLDGLRIRHDGGGTVATARHVLSRPARMLGAETAGPGAPPPRHRPDPLLVLDDGEGLRPRVRVGGPVDGATAARFERALSLAGAAGTRSLTVDLADVSQLASAGVAALHRLLAAHSANDTDLLLYAPAATPADTVLTLVGLVHQTLDPRGGASPGEEPTAWN